MQSSAGAGDRKAAETHGGTSSTTDHPCRGEISGPARQAYNAILGAGGYVETIIKPDEKSQDIKLVSYVIYQQSIQLNYY